jgi:hypothetical protein
MNAKSRIQRGTVNIKSKASEKTQNPGSRRTDHRTLEKRLPDVPELPSGRRRHTDQRPAGCNCMEFEENDGEIGERIFAFYFLILFPLKFIFFRRLKSYC